jgi:hypothetical protein
MVDRIGKGGPPFVPPAGAEDVGGKGAAPEVERPFKEAVDLGKSRPADASSPVEPAAPSALDQLRAGEIDVSGYVEQKIADATAHLQGLAPVELEAIRAMLRDQLATDPALTELVARLTALAKPPDTK